MLAAGGLKALLALLPSFTFPEEAVVRLNGEVLLAAVATAVLTAFLFGLAPALVASGHRFRESISAGRRGNTGARQDRVRNIFVACQVALSLLLLSAGGLLLRSFFIEHAINLGLRTDHLLVSSLNLPAASYGDPARQARFVRDLLTRLEAVPGVVSAAAAVEFAPLGAIATEFDIAGLTHSSI